MEGTRRERQRNLTVNLVSLQTPNTMAYVCTFHYAFIAQQRKGQVNLFGGSLSVFLFYYFGDDKPNRDSLDK